ncbi:serine/threonine-protein kinase pim-2-like [Artemia franciscana]
MQSLKLKSSLDSSERIVDTHFSQQHRYPSDSDSVPRNYRIMDQRKAKRKVLFHVPKSIRTPYQVLPKCNVPATDLEKFRKKYYLHDKKLGKGSYGEVFMGYQRENWKPVAVKKIQLNCVEMLQLDSGRTLPKEVFFLTKVKYIDGCIKLIDHYTVKQECWIVTEYHQNSVTLGEYIFNNQILKENRVLHLFRQIASTVSKLEIAGIAHRDLKCDNILVDENDNVILIDFGLAESLEKANENLDWAPVNPPPEKDLQNFLIGPVTTWSLGIILASLLIGMVVSEIENPIEIIAKKMDDKNISFLSQNLVFQCLNLNRDCRPSPKNILKHPGLVNGV